MSELKKTRETGGDQQRRTRKKQASPVRDQDLVMILRQRIADHEIAPGSKLREQDLAEEFQVARARIREVLSALEMRGLIQREPNRGAVVMKLDLKQIFEVYDVREALEGMCFRLATQNRPPESWSDLVEMFGAPLEELVAQNDIDSLHKALSFMRKRVIEAAENSVATNMLDGIYEKTSTVMRRALILPGRAMKGLKEHQLVLAAMRRGDAAEAERLKRANIRSAIEDMHRFKSFIM